MLNVAVDIPQNS